MASKVIFPSWTKVFVLAFVIVVLGISLFKYVAPNSHPPIHSFDNNLFYQNVGITLIFTFSFLSLVHFIYSYDLLKSTFWNFLGVRRQIPPSTTERIHPNKQKFIAYYYNAQSSVFLMSAGIYIFLRIFYTQEQHSNFNPKYASLLVAFMTFSMGIISYSWWGSLTQTSWLLDNLCMELLAGSLATLFPSRQFPKYEITFLLSYFLIFFVRFFIHANSTTFHDVILPLSMTASYISALVCATTCGSQGQLWLAELGFALMMFGFVPKFADVFHGFWVGTSVFHLMEAVAYVAIFEWSLTLPSYC